MTFNISDLRRSASFAYGCAVLSTALALLARVLLTPYIGVQFPFATVYFAVTITAWQGGLRPALLATTLGFVGVVYFVMTPLHTFALRGLADYIGAGIYLFISLTSALFSEAQHKAQSRAEASALQARQQEAAAHREIEERLRAETALKESRDYYRMLTEAVPQLVWTTRPDGIPDYFNQQWLDYTGQDSKDSETRWNEGVHPDDLYLTMQRWRKAVQTGEPYEIEYRLKGADGTYRWFLTRGIPLKNDRSEIVKWFGTCTDIDQQKRIEQRHQFLAEMSEQIGTLSEPTEVLLSVVNAIGKHLRVTHCTYAEIDTEKNQFKGYRDYSVDGKTLSGVFPLDIFGTELVSAMQAGQTVVVNDTQTDTLVRHHYESIYQPANIRAFICVPLIKEGQWLATLSATMHGEPRVWTLEEISLLEKVMEQTGLAVENVRLYQAERERSKQLTLAIREVHHRVKNNLQAVSALLEMQIDPDTASLPVEKIYDSLSQIKTIALVHDLLAHDKPMGHVDIAQVLTNLVKLLSPGMLSGENSLPIRINAQTVWLSTKAATSLALAVNELLTNAAKHHVFPENKPRTSPAAIEVSLETQEETILVTVQDCGPGFPPNFDPLRDANIGLQLVLTLVQHDLHGTVTFANRSDGGNGETAHGGRVKIAFSEKSVPSG